MFAIQWFFRESTIYYSIMNEYSSKEKDVPFLVMGLPENFHGLLDWVFGFGHSHALGESKNG